MVYQGNNVYFGTCLILSAIILLVATFTTSHLPELISYHKILADGLSQENLSPALIGVRQLSLFVKVNPPILTTTNDKNPYLQFRLFDARNNQTIEHVTYAVTATRGIANPKSERPILIDFFHSHNGLLTLHVIPENISLTVYGKQDAFLQSWVADPGGNILIRGPLLLQGGLYHFHVAIFTIDNDSALVDLSKTLKFDAYVSVGSIYSKNEDYHSHDYNTTLISYFDQIQNFKFDPSKPMFSWSMPFDYNLTRIKQQPIFVHEEMRLPKSWKGFGDLNQFNATVNGQQLSGRSLAIDPFSFPNDMIVHFLVNKNDIVKLAQEVNSNNNNSTAAGITKTNTTGQMKFALSPLNATIQIATSSDIPTNTGSIHAAISWSPNPLAANTQSTLKISFYDPTATAPLTNTDVKYNLKIFDKNNQPVITKQNLLAKNAADTETIVFPANEIYHMQVQITGLAKPGQTQDLTRNGVATGYVVVPEFHSAAISTSLILGVILAGLLARKSIFRGLIK